MPGCLAPAELRQAGSLAKVGLRDLRAVLSITRELPTGIFHLAGLTLDDSQVPISLAKLGFKGHRSSYMIHGHPGIPLLVERPAEVSLSEMRRWVAHVVERVFEQLDRLVVSALLRQDDAEVDLGFGVSGADLQRLVEVRNGIVGLAEGVAEQQRDRVVRLGEPGIEVERSFELCQGAAHVSCLLGVDPEVVMDFRSLLLLFRRHMPATGRDEWNHQEKLTSDPHL